MLKAIDNILKQNIIYVVAVVQGIKNKNLIVSVQLIEVQFV